MAQNTKKNGAQKLSRDLFILEDDGKKYYGGNQSAAAASHIRKYGCGLIAAANLIYYINEEKSYDNANYSALCRLLGDKYLHISRFFGLDGISLAHGLNRYFRDSGLPLRAKWCTSIAKLFPRIEDMLSRDIPVILAAGPNFPNLLGKKSVTLYGYNSKEKGFTPISSMRAHYVTVTSAGENFLKVSSWGRAFFVSKSEFIRYVKNHSLPLFSNIIYIEDRL